MKLQDKSVIVTGAGAGIGRVLALEFAKNGARVVCCGRRAKLLDETVDLINRQGGIGLAVPTDITQHDQVKTMVVAALEHFGGIDVLFNNAGSFTSIAGVFEVDPKTWWHDVSVNLLGSLLCIREVLPHMMDRNRGVIINMGGGRPTGGTGYACGKAGVVELGRILVEELKMEGSNVIILTAGPGLVRTEMTELQANTEAGRKWIPSTAEMLQAGKERRAEQIAATTIEMIRLVKPEHSGLKYGPVPDVAKFLAEQGEKS